VSVEYGFFSHPLSFGISRVKRRMHMSVHSDPSSFSGHCPSFATLKGIDDELQRDQLEDAAHAEECPKIQAAIAAFLRTQQLPQDTDCLILGSVAMYLSFLREDPNYNDLDLVVPAMTAPFKGNLHGVYIDAGPRFLLGERDLTRYVMQRAVVNTYDLRFMATEDLLLHKLWLNRPKDQDDIQLLLTELAHP
jgi:hypothetical protein